MKNNDLFDKNISEGLRKENNNISDNANKVFDTFINKEREKIKGRKYFNKKIIAAVVAASLGGIICVPVAAATIPSFGRLLNIIDSKFEFMLQPIELTSIDNGVKMEVVAAMNDDDMAVVYITMEDLVGDRLIQGNIKEKVIDLDDYTLTEGNVFTSEVIGYDEKNKTATIRMQANGGENLDGKEVGFSVSSYLTGENKYNSKIDISILINSLEKNKVETISYYTKNNSSGGGGMLYLREYEGKGEIKVLKPNEKKIAFPNIDFMHISNIGILDGKLHIQTKVTSDSIHDHGYIYFTDKNGNDLNLDYASINFGIDDNEQAIYGNNYTEYIFELDKINLNDIVLNADLYSDAKQVKGNWNTKFKIKPVSNEKNVKYEMNLGKGTIKEISVSPLGVTLVGKNLVSKDLENQKVEVIMENGTSYTLTNSMHYEDDKQNNVKFIADNPIDVTQVKAIKINDSTIQVK